MVDLASVDQILALAPAAVDAVPLVAVERETSDGQRLALGTGFLDPVVAPAGDIRAVAHLRDDALKSDLGGVGIHFRSIDLEAFAELDVGAVDSLLQVH